MHNAWVLVTFERWKTLKKVSIIKAKAKVRFDIFGCYYRIINLNQLNLKLLLLKLWKYKQASSKSIKIYWFYNYNNYELIWWASLIFVVGFPHKQGACVLLKTSCGHMSMIFGPREQMKNRLAWDTFFPLFSETLKFKLRENLL